MKFWRMNRLAGLVAAVVLVGCGSYGGGSDAVSGGGTSQARSMEEHFSRNVQPSLDFCRTCHMPGAAADVEDGHDFMLSMNKSQDVANLRASWERLGGNNPTSRLLLMPSGQETPHSGGAPWPVGSPQYRNMEILLKCFADADGCGALLGGGVDPGALLPLLGSRHGGHLWVDFCEDKPDGTALPPDPRTLVQPGINQDKAVYYNAYWKSCHEQAPAADQDPTTCGEFRERVARGGVLLKGNGAVGAGIALGGDSASSLLPQALPASTYNNLWEVWGLSQRPDNFDQLAAERYGSALSAQRNPYPLPGEDPNATDGGSGQLPMTFSQTRRPDGSWTGNIVLFGCSTCHSGKVGSPSDGAGLGSLHGTNGQSDLGVILRDVGGGAGSLLPLMLNKTRGTGNITNFQLFGALSIQDPATLPFFLNPLFLSSSTSGTEDMPSWWNLGSRPLKFYDGGQPADAQRIELSTFQPVATLPLTGYQQQKAWIEAHDQDSSAWLMSLKSPAWPVSAVGAIDTALAEQGAILFHGKNLWADNLDNPVPRPNGGNGSCASCHGAYSPRYVNDPAYLDTPAMEGIAGYIVPPAVIGTDMARLAANSEAVSRQFDSSFYGYSEIPEAQCGDLNRASTRGDRENGYLAPPLYGVWASAPYFHNGSVPNVWEVLKSSDRQPVWRRVSTPARADQEGKVVMGYDSDLRRAYDPQRLGWKYDVLACGVTGVTPYLECNPGEPNADPMLQLLLGQIWANGGLLWNLVNVPLLGNAQIEDRKIYNTHMYSQGNGGHSFADVLTDQERRAVIEYLKTL
ncbi:MAG TPA: hypothetical protein VLI06_16555 [Solimonas sp.]|nr:hypothetical protein [Solimonas sp.]